MPLVLDNKCLKFPLEIPSIVQHNDRSPNTRRHFRLRWSHEADLTNSFNLIREISIDILDLIDFLEDLLGCDSCISTSILYRSPTFPFLDSACERGLLPIDDCAGPISQTIKYPRDFHPIPICVPGSDAVPCFPFKPVCAINLTLALPMPDRNRRLVTTFSDS
jgi:hypothetical protein